MFARRFLLAVTGALVALSLLGVGSAASAGAEEDTRAMENDFIARINDLRASQGIAALATDAGQLHNVAVSWAGSMADAGSISHRPNLADVAPSNWVRLGENVGVGSTVESLHNAFVASPGHYRNLVDPAFSTIAVGVIVRDGRIFVTENFMTVSGSAPLSSASASGDSSAAPAPFAVAAPEQAPACSGKKCKAARRAPRKSVRRPARR